MGNWASGDDTGLLRACALHSPSRTFIIRSFFSEKWLLIHVLGGSQGRNPLCRQACAGAFRGGDWPGDDDTGLLRACALHSPSRTFIIRSFFSEKWLLIHVLGGSQGRNPLCRRACAGAFRGGDWPGDDDTGLLRACALHSPSRTFIIRSFFSEKWLLIHVLGGSQGRNPLCRQACAGAFRP